MNFLTSLAIFVALSINCIDSQIRDYCNAKLCQSSTHSACKTTGKFASICPTDIRVVKFKRPDKTLIVDLHNYYRSKVASGDQPLFPSFNEEHSFLSSLQLKTCLSHDPCHNVERINGSVFSGQNIFSEYHSGEFKTHEEYIKKAIESWFNEYQLTTLDIIDKLYFPKTSVIGHFTQIIHDKNSEVGCSMVQWTENDGKEKNVKLTCNYLKAAYFGQPVYKIGSAGADCEYLDLEFGVLCIPPDSEKLKLN
ncbi:unnamed protein product [Diamesa serratosioi]